MADTDDHRARLLKRLAVVADLGWDDRVRLAAVRAVQGMLPEGNPLRSERPETLLAAVLPPWGERLYLRHGRGIPGTVQRPPLSLADVWS